MATICNLYAARWPKRRGLKVIMLRTTKGHGVSFMEGRMEWHYLPLSPQQYEAAITEINSR